jgi:hypothetical protein
MLDGSAAVISRCVSYLPAQRKSYRAAAAVHGTMFAVLESEARAMAGVPERACRKNIQQESEFFGGAHD